MNLRKRWGTLFLVGVIIVVVAMMYACSGPGLARVVSTTEVSAFGRDTDDFTGGGLTGLRVGIQPFAALEPPKTVYVREAPPLPESDWLGLGWRSPVYRSSVPLGATEALTEPYWTSERVWTLLAKIGTGVSAALAVGWMAFQGWFGSLGLGLGKKRRR